MPALNEGVDVPSGGSDDRDDDLGPAGEVEDDELREVAFVDLARARQTSELPTARAGAANLPLGELDPEVLERLAAEMIKRQQNLGAHFYGRRGQKQYGLDILEREAVGSSSVYQVRRYAVLTPDMITSAVTEYADPKPSKGGGRNQPGGSPHAGTCCLPPRSSRRTPRCRNGWRNFRNSMPVTWSSRCGAGRWSAASCAIAAPW